MNYVKITKLIKWHWFCVKIPFPPIICEFFPIIVKSPRNFSILISQIQQPYPLSYKKRYCSWISKQFFYNKSRRYKRMCGPKHTHTQIKINIVAEYINSSIDSEFNKNSSYTSCSVNLTVPSRNNGDNYNL